MIVVADTSQISYLAQLELTELLPRLHGNVIMPPEVHGELVRPTAPERTRRFALNLPAWAQIVEAPAIHQSGLLDLDAGERAAIQLCLETHADLLLVDELKARNIASKVFGLQVAGTLAVLIRSHNAGWINAVSAYGQLCQETSFRHTPKLDQTFRASLTR
jgi:predicted nucleic acid-binding protein